MAIGVLEYLSLCQPSCHDQEVHKSWALYSPIFDGWCQLYWTLKKAAPFDALIWETLHDPDCARQKRHFRKPKHRLSTIFLIFSHLLTKVAKAKLRPKRPKPWGWANCWWTRSGTTDACPAHNYPTPLTLKNHATLHTLFHALDVILCAPNFSRPLQKRCK